MTLPLRAAVLQPLRLKEMAPSDVVDAMARDPRLIVPVGTCEQHGPHLPMGTATIIAERLADDLSASYGVLRAPTVEYGVNVGTEREFAGNATMRKKTLHRMLNDLLGSWEQTGFKEFILVTAHDHDPHQEALDTVTTKWARVRVVDLSAIQLADLLERQPASTHGGEAETSLLLYLAPDLVHLDRAQDRLLARPPLATPDKGRLIFERMRQRVSERIFLAPPPPE